MLRLQTLTWLLSVFTFALAAPASPAHSSLAPRSTPDLVPPPAPTYLPYKKLKPLSDFVPELAASDVAELMLRGVGVGAGLEERGAATPLGKKDALKAQILIAATCVDSSASDVYISSLFFYGGSGTTVYLCQNAVISLTNAIFFSAASQTLTTIGAPTDNSRAKLVVTGPNQACAVFGIVDGANDVALRNIQIDGSRPALGIIWQGMALIEFGGNNVGQVVDNVRAFEPRGWSCLHAIEGYQNQCQGMKITNNQIGPAGHAPSGPVQFRKRDSTGNYPAGQWADGISLACKGSSVTGNVITDATDGGIVIFGAPGSFIAGNQIISVDRQLLGGINLVDWGPYSGSFQGVTVAKNTIISQSNASHGLLLLVDHDLSHAFLQFIKLGIAVGPMTWGVDNRTVARTYGGTVMGNNFVSGPTGYFGYAIGVAGHNGVTLSGNNARQANFGGVESPACFTNQFPLPAPQALVADSWTTPQSVFQKGFTFSTLVLVICRGPGAITKTGVTLS